MRTFLALAAAVLAGCGPAEDFYLDPVTADPGRYRVELENDFVRVLRENVPAGAEVAMHSHRDRVSVYLRDSEVLLTPRGKEPIDARQRGGTASWGDATTHAARVRSDVENLSIELEDLTGEPIPLPENDATIVDPEHHVVELENDRVRILRMTYPAGASSPMHAHLPGVFVVLGDFQLRNLSGDGSVEVLEGSGGEVRWSEGSPAHATENPTDEEVVVIRVEMKRRPARPST